MITRPQRLVPHDPHGFKGFTVRFRCNVNHKPSSENVVRTPPLYSLKPLSLSSNRLPANPAFCSLRTLHPNRDECTRLSASTSTLLNSTIPIDETEPGTDAFSNGRAALPYLALRFGCLLPGSLVTGRWQPLLAPVQCRPVLGAAFLTLRTVPASAGWSAGAGGPNV